MLLFRSIVRGCPWMGGVWIHDGGVGSVVDIF